MITIIQTHEVQDFSTWKTFFNADAANRQKNGLKEIAVFQSVENANIVTIQMEVADVNILNQMMGSPEFQETMKKAGVISAPEVKILKKA